MADDKSIWDLIKNNVDEMKSREAKLREYEEKLLADSKRLAEERERLESALASTLDSEKRLIQKNYEGWEEELRKKEALLTARENEFLEKTSSLMAK